MSVLGIKSPVIEAVEQAYPEHGSNLLNSQNGAVHFDLKSANRIDLQDVGVKHIEVTDICTACRLDDWYSHRGEKGVTGRFGALIGLNPS